MSRRNRRDSEGSEFVLECKAAFLAIFDDIEDKIESKKRLNVVLQQSGRNPNRTALNKYWPEDTTEMYFDDFVEICRKEPVTSADDLMKAFRKIDLNGDGYISLDELYKIMNAQGESMSRDEVRKMIDEVDENKDGRLDYSEFTNMIMKTTEDSKKISKKIMEKKERKKKRAAERLRNAELSAANAASTTTDTAKKQVDSDSNVDELATDVKTEKENLGSMTSLKSSTKVKDDVKGSRSSVRTAAKEQESLSSSRVSIRSQAREEKVNLGSKVSLRSEKARSQRSRADDADVEMGSKVSLQTQNDNENMGSRLSVRSKEIKEKGSNASLWSQMDPSAEGKSVDPVDTASQALGSKASLSWIKEKGSSNEGAESSSRRRDSQLSQKLSPRDEKRSHDTKEPKSLRRDSSEGRESISFRKESSTKDPSSKISPRRESLGKNDKPPKPTTPKSMKNSTPESKPSTKSDTLVKKKKETTGSPRSPRDKLGSSKDSARSVTEEVIEQEDDDIVTPGRPTPRVSLSTPKTKEEPKVETSNLKKDVNPTDDKKAKGNLKDTVDSEHSALLKDSTSTHKVTDKDLAPKKESKRDNEDKQNTEGLGSTKKSIRSPRRGSQDSDKLKTDDLHKESMKRSSQTNEMGSSSSLRSNDSARASRRSKQSIKDEKGIESKHTNDLIDSLFKTSMRSTRSFLESFKSDFQTDTIDQNSVKKEDKEEKVTPKPVPRKDRSSDSKGKTGENPGDTLTASKQLRDSDIGSQTSLRSGDKDLNAPVPSPRKSLSSTSRLLEEDVPRPSPRVMRRGGEESSKGKSPSIRSMRKLPDVRTLEDWTHYTSKGCFFYEEEEIVSHVYRLKMTTDSQVYITAYPVEEPQCLKLPSTEPIDTAIFIFDDQGKLIHCSEQRDTKGTYGIKCELSAGEYQVVPYTTGCRFKQRSADQQGSMKEAKLVKKLDDKVVITSKFRTALEDIFDLCDLDDNGTMSKDEFNWFNLRTSGEELGEDEWDVVEERTELKEGEITKAGFIALNEMEAEDAAGDTDDLWITLSSMGLNKALIMDEACPYRIDVYIEEQSRKRPVFKVTGIESLDKKEYVSEICNYVIDKAGDPVRIKNMKDLYLYTYKTELKATVVVDNRSRSMVNLEVDCSRSRNVVSNREALDHTLDIDPQETAIAHHLMPKSELQDWSISCTETIHK